MNYTIRYVIFVLVAMMALSSAVLALDSGAQCTATINSVLLNQISSKSTDPIIFTMPKMGAPIVVSINDIISQGKDASGTVVPVPTALSATISGPNDEFDGSVEKRSVETKKKTCSRTWRNLFFKNCKDDADYETVDIVRGLVFDKSWVFDPAFETTTKTCRRTLRYSKWSMSVGVKNCKNVGEQHLRTTPVTQSFSWTPKAVGEYVLTVTGTPLAKRPYCDGAMLIPTTQRITFFVTDDEGSVLPPQGNNVPRPSLQGASTLSIESVSIPKAQAVSAGDSLAIMFAVRSAKAQEVRVSATSGELGAYGSLGPVSADASAPSYTLYMDVPRNARAGTYYVRISAGSSVIYRPIQVK